MLKSDRVLCSELLVEAGIAHGFFTRQVGLFPPSVEELQASWRKGSKDRLSILLDELSAQSLALPVQIHASEIWDVGSEIQPGLHRGPKADAALSRYAGVAVGVLTADCVPILLAHPQGRVVAAVHGGWRGLYSGILDRAIAEICRFGNIEPSELIGAVGPTIGSCCYTIGQDLADQFVSTYPFVRKFIRYEKENVFLSLPDVAREMLIQTGLNADRIDLLNQCTRCSEDRFFSHRRRPSNLGRQVSAIRPEL